MLDFTGPRAEEPDVTYELVARTSAITTDSGRVIQALTYNGTAPGPTVRARAGQLVEVVLRNADVHTGVTIHWHGLDVPNAEDGVAGVTQDAVLPGAGAHVPLPTGSGRNILVSLTSGRRQRRQPGSVRCLDHRSADAGRRASSDEPLSICRSWRTPGRSLRMSSRRKSPSRCRQPSSGARSRPADRFACG